MEQSFLPVALEAVKAAESILRHYYVGEVRSRLKPDQTPVSVADEEAEAIIRQIITKHYPDHGFIGEEEGVTNELAEYRWIIDPIDGTKNYLRRIPIFGTLLALMKDNQIILGISNVPMMNELAYAERGKGAFLNDQPIHVSATEQLKNASLSFGGLKYFDKYDGMVGFSQLVRATSQQRSFGDLWQYHLAAQGKCDAILEGQIKIWDIAPATIIIEEAGGRVTDFGGNPITTGSTNIVASNGLLHDQILELIK